MELHCQGEKKSKVRQWEEGKEAPVVKTAQICVSLHIVNNFTYKSRAGGKKMGE